MNRKFIGAVVTSAVSLAAMGAVSYGNDAAAPVEGPATSDLVATPVSRSLTGFTPNAAPLSSTDRDDFRSATIQAGGANDTPLTEDLDLDSGRVIADDDRVGRWSVVPTRTGGGYCVRKVMPASVSAPTVVACAPGLPASGFTWGLGDNGDASGVVVSGLVDSSVDEVRIVTSSGTVVTAQTEGGAFLWAAPNRTTLAPEALVVRSGSNSTRVDLSSAVRDVESTL